MGAQDWVDDITDPTDDDDSDDESTPSLFEENFQKMVNDGEIDSMAVGTLEGQVERIDDLEILKTAIEQDDRDDAEEIYRERLGEINAERQEESEDDVEDDTEPEAVEDDDSDSDESSDEEEEDTTTTDDVMNDLVGDDDDEDDEDDDEEPEPEPEPESAMACVDCDKIVKKGGSIEEPFEIVDDVPVCEDCQEDETEDPEPAEDPEPSPEPEVAGDGSGAASATSDDELPDVDVSSLAPSAISREQAAEADKARTLLVWGPEGSGKSHVAHTSPAPICYIDTEGKADELASKFDKEIHYWQADDYGEAKNALDEALDLLDAYLDAGVRGTLVVDSMTAMWEYAKVDYAKYAYQTENLSEVNFQSELEGEKDWTKIKSRHNDEFREVILESPFHVVFTSGQKEDYNGVFDGDGKAWVPDGEKWNKYAVKDVVRLRRNGEGKTVADLRKAARTRFSFTGVVWPEFDDIYGSIEEIYEAEQAPEPVDVSQWDYGVVDGQPIDNGADGSDDGEDDE